MIPERYLDVFWSRVEQQEEGCWLWSGGRFSNGYGQIKIEGQPRGSHRVMWELTQGDIPDGLCVLHRCDNRPCVRPDHLFLGTKAINNVDRKIKDRGARGERTNTAKLTKSDVLEIRARYAAGGVTQKELGRIFGVKQSNIGCIVRGKYWTREPGATSAVGAKKGDEHPHRKLLAEQVVQIREMYEVGNDTQRELAKKFSISYSQVSLIVNGKAWKHVA